MTFLVRTAHDAEVVFVKMVRLQSQESLSGRLSASADNLSYRDLRVVVADPTRHATEKLERADVPFLERFGTFNGERLNEKRIAVRQRHDTKHRLGLAPTVDHLRLAKVKLRRARQMRKRHEHLGLSLPPTSDLVTHHGQSASVPMFITKPIKILFPVWRCFLCFVLSVWRIS